MLGCFFSQSLVVWYAGFRDLKFPPTVFDSCSLRIPPKYLQFVTAVRVFKLTDVADAVTGLVDLYLVDVGICAMARPDQLFQLQVQVLGAILCVLCFKIEC